MDLLALIAPELERNVAAIAAAEKQDASALRAMAKAQAAAFAAVLQAAGLTSATASPTRPVLEADWAVATTQPDSSPTAFGVRDAATGNAVTIASSMASTYANAPIVFTSGALAGTRSSIKSITTASPCIITLNDTIQSPQMGDRFVVYARPMGVDTSGNGSVNVQNANIPVSGNVDANITNATLDVTGSTVTADLPAGTSVDVGTVSGDITLAAGQTVNVGTVSGDITLATGQTVDVGTVSGDVSLAAGTKVDIGTVDSITAADATIQNAKLGTSSLIYLGQGTLDVSNLANGAALETSNTPATYPGNFCEADGIVYVCASTINPFPYTIALSDIATGLPTGGYIVPDVTVASSDQTTYGANGYYQALLAAPRPTARSTVQLTNSSGATIVSDTVTVDVFAIRAQVQVNNPTSSPAQMQPAKGEFGAAVAGGSNGVTPSSTGATLISSGSPPYIKELVLNLHQASVCTPGWALVSVSVAGLVVGYYWLASYGTAGSAVVDRIPFPDGISFSSSVQLFLEDYESSTTPNVIGNASVIGTTSAAALVPTTT
jgi:hypothetical protein